jgi:hypothetical protein
VAAVVVVVRATGERSVAVDDQRTRTRRHGDDGIDKVRRPWLGGRCRDSSDASACCNAICTRVGRLPAPRFAFREGVLSHLGGERNASALARVRLGQARNVSDENAILRTRCRVLRQLDKPVRRSTVRYSNQSPKVEASLFDRTVADRSRRAATTHGKPHDKEDDDRTEHAHRPAARLLGHGQRC